MTAIDVAVQSKRLGADEVTIVYRRGPEHMGASKFEQELAQTSGVVIRHWAQPKRLLIDGAVIGVEFERTDIRSDGLLRGTRRHLRLDADVVFKAIGQMVIWDDFGRYGKSSGDRKRPHRRR